jgi:hypothetical protein
MAIPAAPYSTRLFFCRLSGIQGVPRVPILRPGNHTSKRLPKRRLPHPFRSFSRKGREIADSSLTGPYQGTTSIVPAQNSGS